VTLRVAALALAAAALLVPAAPAGAAGTARLFGEGGGTLAIPLTTVKELRQQRVFRTTIHQQYDFSCGSAALATLLTHHYSQPVTESEVFQAMWEHGDQAKIKRVGFSLLDMKRYLESRGYQADGFEVSLERLGEARVPAIALIRENGYNHFVVIKGLREDKVLLGDPSAGTRVMARAEFERVWHGGILFVIRNHTDVARFDVPDHWRFRLPAPLDAEHVNSSGLASPTFMMRGPNEF
jgi:predicted double-glycine peptidase